MWLQNVLIKQTRSSSLLGLNGLSNNGRENMRQLQHFGTGAHGKPRKSYAHAPGAICKSRTVKTSEREEQILVFLKNIMFLTNDQPQKLSPMRRRAENSKEARGRAGGGERKEGRNERISFSSPSSPLPSPYLPSHFLLSLASVKVFAAQQT